MNFVNSGGFSYVNQNLNSVNWQPTAAQWAKLASSPPGTYYYFVYGDWSRGRSKRVR